MGSGDGLEDDEMEPMQEEEEEEEEEEEVIGPLVVSEEHENFSLDKIQESDETLGAVNEQTILCKYFDIPILPPGTAVKIKHEFYLLNNTEREYDLITRFWLVDDIRQFINIEVHQQEGDIKYLTDPCHSAILGYQVISNPNKIFIACDRVRLEI